MDKEPTKTNVDFDSWPSDQQREYIPLALIQHPEQRTKQQDCNMAKLTQTGDIDPILNIQLAFKHHCEADSCETLQHIFSASTVSKQVDEIQTPIESSVWRRFVLIEGAPGISFLLECITCQRRDKILFKMLEIMLLAHLHDSGIDLTKSSSDLLCLYCKGDSKAKEISAVCSNYILASCGEDMSFLFDSYDELLKNHCLIAKILIQKLIPLCGIVVLSRPHASVNLCKLAGVRVDILDKTEQEQQHYIEQLVKGNQPRIKALTQYLHNPIIISNICFAPLNTSIFLLLYQLGIPLPNNPTEIDSQFIIQTICQLLVKFGCPVPENITDLSALPESYKNIIDYLAKLSLESHNKNKLLFSSEDIQLACPDMVAILERTDGFGLLQTFIHFSIAGKTTASNFIQEYLAAYYIIITDLRREEELQSLSAGGDSIANSSQFLDDHLKCLRLYQCFKEAGDEKMCKFIEEAEIFNKKVKAIIMCESLNVEIRQINMHRIFFCLI